MPYRRKKPCFLQEEEAPHVKALRLTSAPEWLPPWLASPSSSLLHAMKWASEKVSKAHKQKNQRLKQAKEAAQTEIEQYCLQREKEFKAMEDVALGSPGSCSMEVDKETHEKMTILQTFFQQNRDEVLQHLLAFVFDTWPEMHENG
ncbi:PREDICTED: V-type proton ATPase subunit G 1-like [Odobenus rosmarus divergens]|uniref:V-type proton ATPase subunit G n=1 Tax=Odobenus rosmarus divergens TaxID=9708 RepID=A0A9B0H889_ODORO